MFNKNKYLRGYSIGVGGVVLFNNKVLLVKLAEKHENAGEWSIPGGYVEQNETIDLAIKREIFEETSVEAMIKGLIAVRNRLYTKDNSVYLIFLLFAKNNLVPTYNKEIVEARYFSRQELNGLSHLQLLTKIIATKVLEAQVKLLSCQSRPYFSPKEYLMYV